MRVQDAPRFKESAAVTVRLVRAGAQAVRALSQSGLHPSNCRLLDAERGGADRRARRTGEAPPPALLVLGFESADHELGPWMARALELCADHGGRAHDRGREDGGREPAEGAWRDAFLQAPYLRDTLVAAGVFAETFETAITWDRFDGVSSTRVRERDARRSDGDGIVTCRLTHVYPDGAAPYFTVLAPARRGDELEQWDERQGGGVRGDPRRGRDDHAPPRGRPRPPALVRPPAPRAVRRRAARRQGGRRSRRHPEPRRPDRPVTARRRELARADRVLPGLWRLRLPLPWPGVPHGNAYAIAAGDGVVLVDTGLHEPGSMRQLELALDQAGLRLEHVRLVVCTHAHSDHYGQAAPIMERERRRALDAPEPRAHDEGRRGPGARLRAALRDRAPVGRAGRRARRVPRGARRGRSSASPRS